MEKNENYVVYILPIHEVPTACKNLIFLLTSLQEKGMHIVQSCLLNSDWLLASPFKPTKYISTPNKVIMIIDRVFFP